MKLSLRIWRTLWPFCAVRGRWRMRDRRYTRTGAPLSVCGEHFMESIAKRMRGES